MVQDFSPFSRRSAHSSREEPKREKIQIEPAAVGIRPLFSLSRTRHDSLFSVLPLVTPLSYERVDAPPTVVAWQRSSQVLDPPWLPTPGRPFLSVDDLDPPRAYRQVALSLSVSCHRRHSFFFNTGGRRETAFPSRPVRSFCFSPWPFILHLSNAFFHLAYLIVCRRRFLFSNCFSISI